MTAPRIRPEDRARWAPFGYVCDTGKVLSAWEIDPTACATLEGARAAERSERAARETWYAINSACRPRLGDPA